MQYEVRSDVQQLYTSYIPDIYEALKVQVKLLSCNICQIPELSDYCNTLDTYCESTNIRDDVPSIRSHLQSIQRSLNILQQDGKMIDISSQVKWLLEWVMTYCP